MAHTSVDEHAAHIGELLADALDVGSESVPLDEALERRTSQAVFSPVDLPLFRNSQMDGFAVRAADIQTVPVSIPVVGEVAARAASPAALAPGTAVRIMTGAVVPQGSDTVVPVEDTEANDGAVLIRRSRQSGEYVRDQGSDVRAGDELLPSGQLLAPRHIAVLAAAGIPEVEVRKRVRVAVVTTGAELITPGDEPEPGQVFDSNAFALVAAVRSCGAQIVLARRIVDDPAMLLASLAEAAGYADVIITSGGISKGDYEVVRELLEPRGATVRHLAMQPGGPQLTAMFESVPIVCFPGNPVSTQLSFEVFLAPLLREVAGLAPAVRGPRTLASSLRSVAGKRQFLRGRFVEGGVETVAGPGSHLVAGLAASDVLIVVPEDVTELQAGDTVEVWEL